MQWKLSRRQFLIQTGVATVTGATIACDSGLVRVTPASSTMVATNTPTSTPTPVGVKVATGGAIPQLEMVAMISRTEAREQMLLDSPVIQELLSGIEVRIQPVDGEDYTTKMFTLAAAGTAPDIFEMTSQESIQWIQRGIPAELDDLLRNSDSFSLDGFVDSAVDAFRFEGPTYGIPREVNALVLDYNQELFEEKGIEYPTDDWTWTNLEEAGRVIQNGSTNEIYGFSTPPTSTRFAPFVYQNDGRIISEDFREVLIGSAPTIEAGVFYTNAHNEGWATANTIVSAEELFVNGRLAMIMRGFRPIAEEAFTMGTTSLPAGPKEKEGNLLFTVAYAIWTQSQQQSIAAEVVQVLTSTEAQNIRLQEQQILPSRTLLLNQVEHPAVRAIIDGVARPYQWGPAHREIDDVINQALSNIFAGVDSVEAIFNSADEEIQAILEGASI